MGSLIIGIAGGTGSGKTTVTQKVVAHLDSSNVAVIEHDSYYHDLTYYHGRRPEEINYDHPDALETSLLIRQLGDLRNGRRIEQPLYDFSTHQRREEIRVIDPKRIIIVEGILIFVERELRDLMDLKIFVDTEADERLLRRLKRDIMERGRSIDSVIHQYVTTVRPMHNEFVEPSKHWADIIVPGGVENTVAVDIIVAKIGSLRDGNSTRVRAG